MPKAFISYSWSSIEHEEWVIQLSTDLMESGVEVILDKWDLREGHDANHFMEKMVSDSEIEKVILICDKVYKEKADARKGGAGAETQIITSEIYRSAETDKFCAVISERDADGKAFLPVYYSSRIYIDLSDEAERVSGFEKLVRWIFNKPLYMKPELGKPPSYITDSETSIKLKTNVVFRRAIDALKSRKSFWRPALQDTLTKSLRRWSVFA